MEFFNPGGRGFTVPIAATLASAASRACTSGIRSGAVTPSRPRVPLGVRARARSRTSRIAAVSSSSRTLAAPVPVGLDIRGNPPARRELPHQFRRDRPRCPHDVLKHPIDHVLLKNPQISIRERIHLERLQLQTEPVRHIAQSERPMIRQASFRANRCELRHHDLDLIASAVLIGPCFDLRQIRANAGLGMFICVLFFHFALAAPLHNCLASKPRNCPTSVTTPTAWPVPRSLTLVTTAGLMSTHTILTQLGSMLPVAIECSIDPRHSTRPAPFSCSAYASCARFISVIVSGSGPSSRKLPASTNGTPWVTHACMIPVFSRPDSTA